MAGSGTWWALGAVGLLGAAGAWWWSSRSDGSGASASANALPAPEPGQAGAPLSKLQLSPLPYPIDALAPIVGAETVKVHHGVHQQRYVDGVNRTLSELYAIRQQSASDPKVRAQLRQGLYQRLAFDLGGVVLHELYWGNLAPQDQTGAPSDALLQQIRHDFGSLGGMGEELSDVARTLRGSGWAVLAWHPLLKRLIVLPVGNHDNQVVPGAVPLLVIDVWEHAYYLDRGPDRDAYIRQIWGIVNWPEVSRRFAAVAIGPAVQQAQVGTDPGARRRRRRARQRVAEAS